jgi:hypothetical protein
MSGVLLLRNRSPGGYIPLHYTVKGELHVQGIGD